jgi:hypothetical protein
MLEQQQGQLVIGLQELYRRTQTGQGWEGKPLADASNGHPLTHDILAQLGALHGDTEGRRGSFEEDLQVMQHQLFKNGASAMHREESEDSASEGSQQYPHDISDDTPMFEGNPYGFNHSVPTAPSPFDQTPLPPTPRSENYFTGLDALQQQQQNQLRTRAMDTIFCSSSLQSQSLPASATTPGYDFGFYDQFGASSSTDAFRDSLNRHQSLNGGNAGPCLVPDFVEDDDFSAFVSRST